MTPTAPVRAAKLTFLVVGLLGVAAARPQSMTDGTLAAAHNKAALTFAAHGPAHVADASVRPEVDRAYGRLPLRFESNVGQTDAAVDFIARGTGYALFLTAGGGATFVLERGGSTAPGKVPCDPHRAFAARPSEPSSLPGCLEPPAPTPSEQAVLRLTLPGATSGTRGHGEDPLPGKVHYLTGSNPAAWRSNVATYERIRYAETYPGIDVVYYGNQSRLEYDFVVHPGADPEIIALQFDGADALDVDRNGNLVVSVGGARIVQQTPVIYQERAGVREEVTGGYTLREDRRVGVTLGSYDVTRDVVIDPVLVYSTFLGGTGFDRSFAIAVDATGAAYVAGFTSFGDFPTTSGAFYPVVRYYDAFVTKLSADGSSLAYSTYLGGSSFDEAGAIAVDANGAAYVTGHTQSSDFPTTSGAFDTALSGNSEAFVTKLSADGSSLAYSTGLGGSTIDDARGICVDPTGAAYVTGTTYSSDFPTTVGAVYTSLSGHSDAFVTKLSADGSSLGFSTYLGGSRSGGGTGGGGGGDEHGRGIALDATGAAYVTGVTISIDFPTTRGAIDSALSGYYDAFVTKLSADGTSLSYSTFLGGDGEEAGQGIAVDALGAAYVTGYTLSSDFPTTRGAVDTALGGYSDAFVTKLSADGSSLAFSTYLGGTASGGGWSIAVDTAGAPYVTGDSGSDAFVTKLSADGSSLVFSTSLGGTANDAGSGIALDATGAAYVTGFTDSSDFPTTSGAFDETWNTGRDAFVAKIATRPPTASELAADLVAFVDASIAAGTLVGLGPGASAPNRLSVVRHHIASASAFVAQGKSAPACSHLIDAYRKVDGTAHAFAGGPAAAETRDRIIALRATLGCR